MLFKIFQFSDINTKMTSVISFEGLAVVFVRFTFSLILL